MIMANQNNLVELTFGNKNDIDGIYSRDENNNNAITKYNYIVIII